MHLARQSIMLTFDVVAGKVVRKDPPVPPAVCAQTMVAGATTAALALAMNLSVAQVRVISYQGKTLVSVLVSGADLQRLSRGEVNLNDMCVLVSKFVDVPIYFWSGAGWAARVEDGCLCTESGVTPPPWVCAEDQVEN